MVGPKKNNPADDLMAALLKEVGEAPLSDEVHAKPTEEDNEPLDLHSQFSPKKNLTANSLPATGANDFQSRTQAEYKDSHVVAEEKVAPAEVVQHLKLSPTSSVSKHSDSLFGPAEPVPIAQMPHLAANSGAVLGEATAVAHTNSDKTVALNNNTVAHTKADSKVNKKIDQPVQQPYSDQEKTVAVMGFQVRELENHDDKVKVAIGQNRSAYSSGYAAWGGGSDSNLGQAENLRIAQEKILDLEKENEKLRNQNEELMSASDIIKERSDLLTAQVHEYKSDKENLEESFKNEVALLKAHLQRKDVEVQKSQIKIDDLDSRLKFDMKKIRIRERELENRLELIRAEKNALLKSKDEQILDVRRKMDVLQMEVDSYRQKCIDLNKTLETNQDSFKRTTRALRLAMANLEMQEENKVPLKKVD